MAVKRFKPVTPGTRFRVDVSTSDITTNVPEKSLVVSANTRSGGRNNSGKMTMRYMGGGEGRASGGHPRSRKGILAKGFKTRDKKKTSDRYIIERRKK